MFEWFNLTDIKGIFLSGLVYSWIIVASSPPALKFPLFTPGWCLPLNPSAMPTSGTCRFAVRSHTHDHPATGPQDYLAGIAPPFPSLITACWNSKIELWSELVLTWLHSFFRPFSSSLSARSAISVEPFLASCWSARNRLAPEQWPEEWQKDAERTRSMWSSTGKAKGLRIGHRSNEQVHMLWLA